MAIDVKLTLAHPLTADQASRLRAADVKDYNVGDAIILPLAEARAVINAGYAAGVDPENRDQVQAALTPAKPVKKNGGN